MDDNSLVRWSLVLGAETREAMEIEISKEDLEVDQLLESVYGGQEGAGFGKSSGRIKKWLDGIRLNFPTEVVQIMQQDALERQGVKEMLLEPELLEKIEASVSMVATILQLQHLLPDKARNAARHLVQQLVREIEERIKYKLVIAVQKAKLHLSKPVVPSQSLIDWKKTIQRNLKNYQPLYQSIIPEKWYGYRKGSRFPEIFIVVDTSESMAESVIYSAIVASVLASLKSVETHLVFFNTEIMDFTDKYDDPVQLLFSAPYGGGTDIALAMQYVAQKIRQPSECLVFLISDLYEGGSKVNLLNQLGWLRDRGVNIFSLLSLADSGTPEYDRELAQKFSAMGIPCFACSPDQFAELLTNALSKNA